MAKAPIKKTTGASDALLDSATNVNAPVDDTSAPTTTKGKGKTPAKGKAAVSATTTEGKATPKVPAKKSLTAAQQKNILEGKAVPVDAINDTITAIENVKGAEAVALVKSMLESNDFNDFKIGGLLSVIDVNGYWRDHGYTKFRDFIEQHYGMKYRKAMYLSNIYNSLVESGVEWDQVKSLGWTKLKEICAFLTVDNVDKWVDIASGMTVIALIEYIKTCDEDGNPKGNTAKTTNDNNPTDTPDVSTMTFKVHTAQREVIREALDKSRAECETEYDNVALEHMSMQYLQGTLGKKGGKPVKQKSLEELIAAEVEASGDDALETLLTLVAAHYPEYDISVAPAEEEVEYEEAEGDE